MMEANRNQWLNTPDFIIENSRNGWASVAYEIRDWLRQHPSPHRIVMQIELPYIHDNDLLQVQAIFPLLWRIRRYYESDIPLHVVINTSVEKLWSSAVQLFGSSAGQRISVFRKIAKDNDGEVTYWFTEASLPGKIDYGRIIPIFHVSADHNDDTYFRSIMDLSNSINDDEIDVIYRTIENDPTIKKSNLIHTLNEVPQSEVIREMTLHNLSVVLLTVVGTADMPFSKEMKSDFRKLLCSFMHEHIVHMTPLCQMIWSCIARCLYENKEIAVRTHGEMRLLKSTLAKSLADANAYAEGLYQLLENSCLHTQAQRGCYCLRVYHVDRTLPASEIKSAAASIEMLHKKYSINKKSRDFSYTIDRNLPFVMEIVVMDDAYVYDKPHTRSFQGGSRGITATFGKSRDLRGVFERTLNNAEDAAYHYGLQLFTRNVILNGGCFMTYSPDTQILEASHCEIYAAPKCSSKKLRGINSSLGFCDKYDVQQCKEFYRSLSITEFNILVPISYEWQAQQEIGAPVTAKTLNEPVLFNQRFIGKEFQCRVIKPETAYKVLMRSVNSVGSTNEKIKQVNEIARMLEPEFNQDDKESAVYVDILDLSFCNYLDIELVLKALFLIIAKQETMRANLPQQWALFFKNNHFATEALRLFSVYYDKAGNNQYMKDMQIAFCTPNCENDGAPEVVFLLAGSTLESARKTAEVFSYYHVDSTLSLIPDIRYLTRVIKTNRDGSAIQQFPFDITLNYYPKISNGTVISWQQHKESWFLSHIRRALNMDIRDRTYGCKISDIHIRLGSSIHIDTFYAAELLFNNMGNVHRFAYLLASDIFNVKKLLPSDQPIILVGYDRYSSVLILEVASLLKSIVESDKQNIYHAMYSNENRSNETIEFCYSLNGTVGDKIKEYAAYFIILPIGSTMSTLYRIQSYMRRKVGKEDLVVAGGWVMVLAGQVSEAKTDEVHKHYWEKNKEGSNNCEIVLKKESKSDNPITVKYYVDVPANWYFADNCELCNAQKRALLHVDESSTRPITVFELHKSNRKSLSQLHKSETKDNMRYLFGCLTYAHTWRENNHYQFYIDFTMLYHHANKEGAVVNWLRKCPRKPEGSVFNLVVSPLSETNSSFLHAVVGNAFSHCLRFMHIPVLQVLKESIRTKFSYIAEEYRKIKMMDPHAVIRAYYVDDSIVTGQTISRARTILRMIFMESGLHDTEMPYFDGIFLLVNRSSYETIATFVKDPKNEFNTFINLAVPSYNTFNDSCPACSLIDSYELSRKRSSTVQLSNEYMRLSDKHKKRDSDEYHKWLETSIVESHGYLSWLKYWLYTNIPGADCAVARESQCPCNLEDMDKAEIELARDRLLQRLRECYSQCKDPVEWIENAHKTNIRQLYKGCEFELDDLQEELRRYTDIIKRNIIAERNHMRMECTHRLTLEFEAENRQNTVEYARDVLFTLLNEKFSLIDKCEYSPHQCRSKKIEWLIAYIKVFARNPMSQYHIVRQAAFEILTEMLRFILEDNCKDAECQNLLVQCRSDEPGDELSQYKLMQCVARKLADLESNYFLTEDAPIRYYKYTKQLHNRHKDSFYSETGITHDSSLLNDFPTESMIVLDYMKLVKWTATIGRDESKCLMLERIITLTNEKDNEISATMKLLLLENIRVIYSGVELLNRMIGSKNNQQNVSLHDKSKAERETIYTEFARRKYNDSLEENGNYLRQNPLFLFFQFMKIREAVYNNTEFLMQAIGEMMQLATNVNALYNIDSNISGDTRFREGLFYQYCSICDSIYRIMDCETCYLVHESGGHYHVLAHSQLEIEKMNRELTQHEIRDILAALKNKWEKISYSSPSSVMVSKINSNNSDMSTTSPMYYIRICLFSDSHEEIMFLLESAKAEHLSDVIVKARNILFLRERLSSAIERDAHVMVSSRYEYSHIRPRSKNGLRILHMTDLHVTVHNETKMFDAVAMLEKDKDIHEFDLLCITGDIAGGANSAQQMAENYKAAGRIIQKIAGILWKTNTNNILQDWKKRVIIIPGNHDYAMMNELQTLTAKRRLAAGMPAAKEGGVMAKFAYYVDFLHDALDADISSIIHNGLNELRVYETLNLKVLCVNTVSGAGPLRSNKVKVNDESIRHLLSDEKIDKYHRICLMHHAPTEASYPNYARDVYAESKFFKYKEYRELAELIYGKWISDSASSRENIQAKYGEIYRKLEAEKTQREDIQNDLLLQEVKCILEEYDNLQSEQRNDIQFRIKRDSKMSKTDCDALITSSKLIRKKFEANLILGGHIHRINEKEDFHDCLVIVQKQYVSFGDKESEAPAVYYGVYTFEMGRKNGEYVDRILRNGNNRAEVTP